MQSVASLLKAKDLHASVTKQMEAHAWIFTAEN
jgi:hypothetical protein